MLSSKSQEQMKSNSLLSIQSPTSNPWNLSNVSPLEYYCDEIICKIDGISVKKTIYQAEDENDVVHKLRKADKIIKYERKKRLQEKLRTVQNDATSVFSLESLEDIIYSCKQLNTLIKTYNSSADEISKINTAQNSGNRSFSFKTSIMSTHSVLLILSFYEQMLLE